MHYLSILAILKNEAMNLKIWIDHYLWQGVDHFYLIDNGSDDESNAILKDLIAKGYPITLYELPEKHRQMQHYHYVYDNENLREKTKWLIIADLDEFFYCLHSTIKNELPKWETFDYISSRWRLFGSNNLDKHPADIRVGLTTREEALRPTPKYIIQPKNIESQHFGTHFVTGGYQRGVDLSDVFRLNHYVIQSREYYEKVKMSRGDVACSDIDNVRDWNYFKKFDAQATYIDEDLKHMVEALSI